MAVPCLVVPFMPNVLCLKILPVPYPPIFSRLVFLNAPWSYFRISKDCVRPIEVWKLPPNLLSGMDLALLLWGSSSTKSVSFSWLAFELDPCSSANSMIGSIWESIVWFEPIRLGSCFAFDTSDKSTDYELSFVLWLRYGLDFLPGESSLSLLDTEFV